VSSEEIREALRGPASLIIEGIRVTLERTGPELSGDLVERGMTLCGGGVLVRGFDKMIREETGLPVHFADDPLTAVARGTGIFLERLDEFKGILESATDEL
jgi:rod shape-determining protein MreB